MHIENNCIPPTSGRVDWVDLLKGLAILLVVMGHMPYDACSMALKTGIYSFHMPLFFVLAGYAAALSMSRSTSPLAFFRKRLISVFLPYLCWSFMIVPFASAQAYSAYSLHDKLHNFVTGNVACWFLPCLLCLQLLFTAYTMVTRRFRHAAVKVCTMAALFTCITICHKLWGHTSDQTGYWALDFLTTTYKYFPDFAIGAALYYYPKFKAMCTGNVACTLSAVIVVALSGVRPDLPYSEHFRNLIGIAASFLLIRLFSTPLLPERANAILRSIGKDTLIIYLVSGTFLPATCTWFTGADATMAFIIYTPVCLVVCLSCVALARILSTAPLLSLLLLGQVPRKKLKDTPTGTALLS